MTGNAESRTPRIDRSLVILLAGVTLAFLAIMLPFYGAVMWAAILAMLFRPMQRWWLRRLKGRNGWAAFATLSTVILIVILPLLALATSLARQGMQMAQAIQAGQIDVLSALARLLDLLPAPVADLLQRFDITDAASLRRRIEEGADQASQFLAGQVLNIGQSSLNFLVGLFVALYVAFFLLRDGEALSTRVWSRVPMRDADKVTLRQRLAAVVHATVRGNFVVAGIQGALGGLALWLLDFPGAMLWGATMAVLSLLPAVGAALVWLPIALYLMASGSVWQGVGLAAFGALVIGLIDNVLRPALVGRETRLPDWLVLVSTLGGIALLGINGFVIGPVVAALFVAAWEIHGRRAAEPAHPDAR